MSTFTSPLLAAVTGAVAAAVIVGGVAMAQTSTAGVITACVAENSGNVRIVTSAGDCKAHEKTTSWNQQGPHGVPGANGTNGVSGWVRVVGDEWSVPAHTGASAVVRCPAGTRILGGGYAGGFERTPEGTVDALTFYSSHSFDDGAWVVSAVNPTGTNLAFRPVAQCATAL